MTPAQIYDKPEWHHQGGPTWQAHPLEKPPEAKNDPPPPDRPDYDPTYWEENMDAIVALMERDKRYAFPPK